MVRSPPYPHRHDPFSAFAASMSRSRQGVQILQNAGLPPIFTARLTGMASTRAVRPVRRRRKEKLETVNDWKQHSPGNRRHERHSPWTWMNPDVVCGAPKSDAQFRPGGAFMSDEPTI